MVLDNNLHLDACGCQKDYGFSGLLSFLYHFLKSFARANNGLVMGQTTQPYKLIYKPKVAKINFRLMCRVSVDRGHSRVCSFHG